MDNNVSKELTIKFYAICYEQVVKLHYLKSFGKLDKLTNCWYYESYCVTPLKNVICDTVLAIMDRLPKTYE